MSVTKWQFFLYAVYAVSIDDVIVYGRNESRLKAHGQNKPRGKLMIFAQNFNFLPIQKVYIFVELNFSQFTATNLQKTNLKALAVFIVISWVTNYSLILARNFSVKGGET